MGTAELLDAYLEKTGNKEEPNADLFQSLLSENAKNGSALMEFIDFCATMPMKPRLMIRQILPMCRNG